MSQWLQTDEGEDVAASVRHALRSYEFVSSDAQAWKWVALAIHAALQGACVCHLVTTAVPIGAVTKRNAVEWLAYFEVSRTNPETQPPRTFLLSLPDLLKKIRRSRSAGDGSNDSGVGISDAELEWLHHFHDEIRNQFSHFEPRGWSIEVSGIPDLAKLISRIIGDILDLGWAFRHKTEEWKVELRHDLHALSNMR